MTDLKLPTTFLCVTLAGIAFGQSARAADDDVASAPIVPIAATASSSATFTSHRGDTGYTQQARAAETIALSTPVSGQFSVGALPGHFDLRRGTKLFKVDFQTETQLHAYCTFDIIRTARGHSPPSLDRVCLTDDNSDGSLDHSWILTALLTASRTADGEWVLPPIPTISGGMVLRAGELRTVVHYEAVPNEAAPRITIGLVAMPFYPDGADFQVAEIRDGGAIDFGVPMSMHSVSSGTLPLTLDILGAQIQISAIDQDTISYRVMTGFPDDHPITGTPRVPPPAPPSPPRH